MMDEKLRDELAKELERCSRSKSWGIYSVSSVHSGIRFQEQEAAKDILPWLQRKLLEARIEEMEHVTHQRDWVGEGDAAEYVCTTCLRLEKLRSKLAEVPA